MEFFIEQVKLIPIALIGTLVFWYVLYRLAWKPLVEIIDQRRALIEQGFREAERRQAELDQRQKELEERLQRIEDEAQKRFQEAMRKGEELAEKLREEAELQKERMLQRAREEIEREREAAKEEIRRLAVDLSFDLTRKVLREGLDEEKHHQLVKRFIGELREL